MSRNDRAQKRIDREGEIEIREKERVRARRILLAVVVCDPLIHCPQRRETTRHRVSLRGEKSRCRCTNKKTNSNLTNEKVSRSLISLRVKRDYSHTSHGHIRRRDKEHQRGARYKSRYDM